MGFKRVAVLVVGALALVGPAFVLAEQPFGAIAAEAQRVHGDSAALAQSITEAAGVNVSPILVMGAMNGYRWFATPVAERGRLPWDQQPWFWAACLALVGFLFVAQAVPGLRTTAEGLNLHLKKAAGLAGAVASVIRVADVAAAPASRLLAAVGEVIVPSAAAAGASGGHPGPIAVMLAWPLVFVLGLVIAGAVWLLFQAIGVLVFVLSPFAPMAATVRFAKLMVLLTLAVAAAIHPLLGAGVALIIAVIAILVAGWAFRLVTFGAILSWDLLTLRRARPEANGPIPAFCTNIPGVPRRSWGVIARAGDALTFSWRPWLILPARQADLRSVGPVAIGLISPVLLGGAEVRGAEIARFPPRFRGSHEEVAAALGGLPVIEAPLVKGIKAAWAWLRGATALAAPKLAASRARGAGAR